MTAIAIQVGTDGAPTLAPYRISDKPGHDTVTVRATVTTDDGSPIRALRVIFDDPSRDVPAVASLGAVCGLAVCGDAVPLAAPSGTELTVAFDYADTGRPPDGTYDVTVYALSESEGWT